MPSGLLLLEWYPTMVLNSIQFYTIETPFLSHRGYASVKISVWIDSTVIVRKVFDLIMLYLKKKTLLLWSNLRSRAEPELHKALSSLWGYVCQSGAPRCNVWSLVQLPSGVSLWFNEIKAYKALISGAIKIKIQTLNQATSYRNNQHGEWVISLQVLNGPFCLAVFQLFVILFLSATFRGSLRLVWQTRLDWPAQGSNSWSQMHIPKSGGELNLASVFLSPRPCW